MQKSTRPLIISFAQQSLVRQKADEIPELNVRFVDDIAAVAREEVFGQAVGMIAAGNSVSENTLTGWNRLEFVQTLGSGYNNLDLAALANRQVVVAHNPGQNAQAVAEHALMSAMYLLREMGRAQTMVLQGKFTERHMLAGTIRDLSGMTMGIYGLGTIGKSLAHIAGGFGMRLTYYQRHREREFEAVEHIAYVDPHELWTHSDIVVMTLPLTRATFHLVGDAELGLMPRSSVLINVGRGAVVDQEALASALSGGEILGAALDVFEKEPLDESNPLMHLPPAIQDRLLLSPHVSGVTRQALEKMAQEALRNVMRYFDAQAVCHQLVPEPGVNLANWRNASLQK